MIRVTIDGILKAEDAEGRDLTPRGAKTRGLLALLVTSKGFKRSRPFLQDKLWSTRAPEQGSASLRQALTELRKAFAPHSGVVVTKQGVVGLNEDLVEIVRLNGREDIPFEDLNIRDPEFESWLRDIRLQLSNAEGKSQQPALEDYFRPKRSTANPAVVFINKSSGFSHYINPLKEQLTRSIWEIADVDVFDIEGGSPAPQRDQNRTFFQIECHATEAFGTLNLALSVSSQTGRQLWRSDVKRAEISNQDQITQNIEVLSRQSCLALLELWRPESGHLAPALPLSMFSNSFREAFSFSRSALEHADSLARLAYSAELNPVFLAWQAFLRNTARFEHLTDDFLETRDNEVLIATAMSEAPDNSLVLALAGQHSMVNHRDMDYGKYLCERALEENSSNPLAWAFLSNIHSVDKNYPEALVAAEHAFRLSKGHPLQSFVTIFRCMAHIGMNNLDTAILDAQFASAISPEFQAIRRYLLASSLVVGREDLARRTLREIRMREPDFRNSEFMNANYPVGTLREMPLIDRLAASV